MHNLIGAVNPRCTRCGLSAIVIAANRIDCSGPELPLFDSPRVLGPHPAEADDSRKDQGRGTGQPLARARLRHFMNRA